MTEQKLDRQPKSITGKSSPAGKTSPTGKSSPEENPNFLWRSGEMVEWEKATVHLSELAWSAISAVFEGVRAYWNPQNEQLYIFHLDAHLKRLFQSMKIMRMTSPFSKEDLTGAFIQLLKANECRSDTYIQPLAYFGGGVPGYLAVLERPGEIVITTRPAASGLDEAKVVHCNVSSWSRISDNVMPPRAKAITNYQNSRYVSTESQINGYDFGIILNMNGKVSEAAYACIFLIRDGVAVTPPLSAGILESITREAVKDLLTREMDIPVIERDVDRTELYVADEVFLTGTAAEITPVREIDGRTIGLGKPGPVTTELQNAFFSIVRGEDPAHAMWLTRV